VDGKNFTIHPLRRKKVGTQGVLGEGLRKKKEKDECG